MMIHRTLAGSSIENLKKLIAEEVNLITGK